MRRPNEFTLLTLIAWRARRKQCGFDVNGLQIGEALIGDYKACGLTEQKYRTAKNNLEAWGLVTFKATNKGTIAKLNNTKVYDINQEDGNDLTNGQETDKQRPSNDQATTNKKVRKKDSKNIGGKFTPPPLDEVIKFFTENGFSPDLANKAWNYYQEANPPWTDAKGNKVRSWKQKMRGVWMKDENSTQPETSRKPKLL